MHLILDLWLSGILYNLKPENIFSPFFKDAILFAALAALITAELLICGWKRSTVYLLIHSGRTGFWDLFSVAIYASGVRRILTSVFSLGIIGLYFSLLFHDGSLVFATTFTHQWPRWLKYALVLLTYDFVFYWSHRLKHVSGWLWNLHEFHHSSRIVNLFTTYRSHPLETILYQLLITTPICFLFDLSVTQSIYFLIITGIFGLMNHARFDTDFGILGKYVFVSPRMHHLHHSIEKKNYNFGEIFVFWDKLFGTYCSPEYSIDEISQGLDNNFYDSDPWLRAFLKPVFRFYGALIMFPNTLLAGRNAHNSQR